MGDVCTKYVQSAMCRYTCMPIWFPLVFLMLVSVAGCILCYASNERDEDQNRLTYDKESKVGAL